MQESARHPTRLRLRPHATPGCNPVVARPAPGRSPFASGAYAAFASTRSTNRAQ